MKRCKKQNWFRYLMVLLAMLLFCGCTGVDNGPQQDAVPPEDAVYIVHREAGVINSWNVSYGAIRHDGTMVLPIQYPYLEILYDMETDEPRYLQTRDMKLTDETLMTDELKEAYYQQLYTGEGDTVFEEQWQLFDMEGNPVKQTEDCGIRRICGDLTLYRDNRLVHEPTGEVLFDNCVTVNWGENAYIISYDQYNSVCVMNRNLDVLMDVAGSDGFMDSKGRYLIITQEETEHGEKQGLCRIDGTQIVPNEYDYFMTYYSVQTPYVQAVKDRLTMVLSLDDGREIYRTADEYEYIQDMFADCMMVQTRHEAEDSSTAWPVYEYRTQLYNYEGRPVGKSYESLSAQTDLYERTLRETGEGVLLFTAQDETGIRYLIDENGKVLYTSEAGEWISVLTEDCIIVNGLDGKGDRMCSLDGTVLNEKPYENINSLYLGEPNGYINCSELAVGWYTYNNANLMDILDTDGNVLIERLKSVNMLAEDRFWIEKGFSRGLIDTDGNWLYEESVFTSAADE